MYWSWLFPPFLCLINSRILFPFRCYLKAIEIVAPNILFRRFCPTDLISCDLKLRKSAILECLTFPVIALDDLISNVCKSNCSKLATHMDTYLYSTKFDEMFIFGSSLYLLPSSSGSKASQTRNIDCSTPVLVRQPNHFTVEDRAHKWV